MRQAGENLDPAHQGPEIVAHRVVGIAGGRIGLDAPVGDERIARPFRERLAGRDVAQRDDEVHARRAAEAELLQALGVRARDGHVMPRQELDGVGVERSVRIAAGAEGAEASGGDGVENHLRHDAERGVVFAYEQNVHGGGPSPQRASPS